MGGVSADDVIGGVLTGGLYPAVKYGAPAAMKAVGSVLPKGPDLPKPPLAPDAADAAVRNARLMERRKQLGLTGRMSTFLTTAQGDGGSTGSANATARGDRQPSSSPAPLVNLLGG